MTSISIGERLRLEREYRGLSCGDVADHMDVEQSRIASVERGEREPTQREIGALADLYRIRAAALTGDDCGDDEAIRAVQQAAADACLTASDQREVARFAEYLQTTPH